MNLPNYITLFRILLTPVFFTTLLSYEEGKESLRWTALIIFIVAALTDAIDGLLARITQSKTELGRFLDPLADKLLLIGGFIGILFVEALPLRPPLWITVTIVFRDIVILGGLIVIFLIAKKAHVQPNLLGKATTASQMICLILILLVHPIAPAFWILTAILSIASMLWYVMRDLGQLMKGKS